MVAFPEEPHVREQRFDTGAGALEGREYFVQRRASVLNPSGPLYYVAVLNSPADGRPSAIVETVRESLPKEFGKPITNEQHVQYAGLPGLKVSIDSGEVHATVVILPTDKRVYKLAVIATRGVGEEERFFRSFGPIGGP